MVERTCAEWLHLSAGCVEAFQNLIAEASFDGDDSARAGALVNAVHDAWDFAYASLSLAQTEVWGPARALLRGLNEREWWLVALHNDAKFARDVIAESAQWEAGGKAPRGGFRRAQRIWERHFAQFGDGRDGPARIAATDHLYRARAADDHPSIFAAKWAAIAVAHPDSSIASHFGWDIAAAISSATFSATGVAIERGNGGPNTKQALDVSSRLLRLVIEER